MNIKKIEAHTVFDSRGVPTIECLVTPEQGPTGSAIVPSGASTGRFEALELRDGDKSFFAGKSVNRAIDNIYNIIEPALIGKDITKQKEIDALLMQLDGTPNKSKLGANAILAVSMAVARTSSMIQDKPLFNTLQDAPGTILPLPEIQIIGGGAHSSGRIDIQDFMIICTGAADLMEVYQMTFDVYQECAKLLQQRGKLGGVADEGGFWPLFDRNEEGVEFLIRAIEAAGYVPGEDIMISLDIAASEFHVEGYYQLRLEDRKLSAEDFYRWIEDWLARYPICSIEDPFAEEDTECWQELNYQWGDKVQIIGDDLFVTHKQRLDTGIKQNLANSILIKLNQIGTVTETIDCIQHAMASGWRPVVSARSGETEDPFISHLAVATNAGQLKVGSFTRSERMVKWNELLRISRILGSEAQFANEVLHFPWQS